MPPTRAVKSVGRANLLKNIQATLQSSQDVIDDAPANSSSAGVRESGPSGRVTTIAELLRSQNQEPELGCLSSDDSEEDDFFVPSHTQMALGATQTPTNQDAMDTSWTRPVLGPAEGQTTDIPDSQTANPPNATPASRIAEFDETEEIIEDAMEVCDSSDNDLSDSGSDDGETENPEFLFLDSQNAENTGSATKEVESTEIPENMFTEPSPKDTSENVENIRWVFIGY